MAKSWTFHDALRAVLLFHDGGPWTEAKKKEWRRITGGDVATTAALCDHVRWIVGGGGTFGSHPAHGDDASGHERVYMLNTVGHVLTEQDVADIAELLDDHNEQIGEAASDFHRGGLEALRRIGGDQLVNAVETRDEIKTSEIVDRAMSKVRADLAAKRSS